MESEPDGRDSALLLFLTWFNDGVQHFVMSRFLASLPPQPGYAISEEYVANFRSGASSCL
jgi:hypothetical protein